MEHGPKQTLTYLSLFCTLCSEVCLFETYLTTFHLTPNYTNQTGSQADVQYLEQLLNYSHYLLSYYTKILIRWEMLGAKSSLLRIYVNIDY